MSLYILILRFLMVLAFCW